MKHIDAFTSYLKLIKKTRDLYWEWQFMGVIQMGVIVCSSEVSRIRQRALEEGLLFYINFEKGPLDKIHEVQNNGEDNQYIDTANEADWKIRSAATISLIEVYQQYGGEAPGLLARETLHSRKKIEKNNYVLDVLNSPSANIQQNQFARQISFLSKYICSSIAEMYSDSQSDYNYFKKNYKEDIRGPLLGNRKKGKRINKSNKPPTNLSTRNDEPKVILSIKPYHQNYKKMEYISGECLEDELEKYFKQYELIDNDLPFDLTYSKLGQSNKLKLDPIKNMSNGTINRRKLVNARHVK